jgi:CelD/BcsL family acetyltransferase involved in cellulose biosynthesis
MSATLDRIADFKVISSESAFAELRDPWDDLVRAMPRPSPFLLHGWLLEWLRHYGGGSELAVQAAFSDGRLVGAFPLFRKFWRRLRVTRFLGGAHPSLADLLLAPGEDGTVGAALLERASSEHDFAELFGLAGQSRAASIAGPAQLQLFERAVAPVLELTNDWDAIYAAKVSSARRKDERRRRRRLEERGTVELSLARSPEEVEAALADAFRLHELRWRGRREDTSGFATPGGISFHRDALGALAAQDVIRLFTIRLGGRAIAFELTFELAGRLYLYRTAFDPAFARYGPGLLVLLDVIAYASRERMSRVEFLGGGETYKLALADRLEPLHLGLGLAATARGRAVVTTRTSVLRLRERLKHSPTARRAYDSTRAVRTRLTRPKNDLRT